MDKHKLPDEIKLKKGLKVETRKLNTVERYLEFLEDAKQNPDKHSLTVLNDPDEHFRRSEMSRKATEKYSIVNHSNGLIDHDEDM